VVLRIQTTPSVCRGASGTGKRSRGPHRVRIPTAYAPRLKNMRSPTDRRRPAPTCWRAFQAVDDGRRLQQSAAAELVGPTEGRRPLSHGPRSHRSMGTENHSGTLDDVARHRRVEEPGAEPFADRCLETGARAGSATRNPQTR